MYRKMQIHFIGIGGAGMSGIAEVLSNLGHHVSGSDIKMTPVTERLKSLGIRIYEGHREEQVEGADVVVVSSAIRRENVEVLGAHKRNIPIVPRAQMLAELMRMKYGIAVAGTHGKTTTTSLVSTVLAYAGLDPTAIIGGRLKSIGTNAQLGTGDFLVAEADESDGTFLLLTPTIAVITSIDPEHLDFYGEFSKAVDAYREFLSKVPFYGLAVLCKDEPRVACLPAGLSRRFVTYGSSEQADIRAKDMEFIRLGAQFSVFRGKESMGRVALKAPGRHNVLNSLAAIAVGLELGVPFSVINEALKGFSGVERRFEIKGEIKGIMVVDDYGHHPEEIKATLRAARDGWSGDRRRIVVIFQPHRYTRTRDLFNEFLHAFDLADIVFLTDIYPAGEDPIPQISAEGLAGGMRDSGHKGVKYFGDREALAEELRRAARPGDMVITLGAGDVWKIGESFLAALHAG